MKYLGILAIILALTSCKQQNRVVNKVKPSQAAVMPQPTQSISNTKKPTYSPTQSSSTPTPNSTSLAQTNWKTSCVPGKSDLAAYYNIVVLTFTDVGYTLSSDIYKDAACTVGMLQRVELGTYIAGAIDQAVPQAKDINITLSRIYYVYKTQEAISLWSPSGGPPNGQQIVIGSPIDIPLPNRPAGSVTLGLYTNDANTLNLSIDSNVNTRPLDMSSVILFTKKLN